MKKIEKIAIITSYIRGSEDEIDKLFKSEMENSDLIIAADGGLDHAVKHNIDCDIILGDFDSISSPPTQEEFPDATIIELPVRKDVTDLQFALDTAIEYKPQRITILGGIGGQTDHTIGNIQSMAGAYEECENIKMIDPMETIYVQGRGKVTYPAPPKDSRFSVLALGGNAKGVTIKGGSYELDNSELLASFPLGVSNVSIGKDIFVEVKIGMVVVITHSHNLSQLD